MHSTGKGPGCTGKSLIVGLGFCPLLSTLGVLDQICVQLVCAFIPISIPGLSFLITPVTNAV